MSKYAKALVALVPLVTTLVAHFAGEGSDAAFVWATVVTALTALGVYAVPNRPRDERGQSTLFLVVLVAVVTALCIAVFWGWRP